MSGFDFGVDIKGADQIINRMHVLPEKLQRHISRKSARRALVPVRAAARMVAQEFDDPNTKRSIYRNVAIQYSARQSRQIGGVVMRVGIRGGAKRYVNTRENRRKRRVGQEYLGGGDKSAPGGDTFYWRFLEFGTEKMGARPFLRPALENNAQAVSDLLTMNVNRDLDELALGK